MMRRPIVFLLILIAISGVLKAQDTISTFAGGGPNHVPGANPGNPQSAANLNQPTSVAVDASGNIYIASPAQHRIFRVDGTTGTLTVLAGNGTPGSGNECTQGNSPGCASPARTSLHSPQALAVDANGNVFIADSGNNVIRVVNTQASVITLGTVQVQPGAIATIAGNGASGYGGDGGPASAATLARPFGLTVDASEVLYIADIDNNRIRAVNLGSSNTKVLNIPITIGNIATVAGTGVPGFSGDGGPAIAASLNQPMSVAVDNLTPPDLYIGDGGNYRVRMVDPGGAISTFAGNGVPGNGGDGGPPASANLGGRLGLAVYGSSHIFIADGDSGEIREAVVGGNINTVAGDKCFGYGLEPSDCKPNIPGAGDGNPATSASLDGPLGVAVDASGNFYIADTGNYRLRAVNTSGSTIVLAGVSIGSGDIETLAGNGLTPPVGGDGSAATSASLNSPQGLATDSAGNLFIADTDSNLIRAVNTQTTAITIATVTIQPGALATVAGTINGTGNVTLNGPAGVAVNASENIFIADTADQLVVKVDSGGHVTTIAGLSGKAGYTGDSGAASLAQLNFPSGVAVDASGNLYIADTDNQRVRAVNLTAAPVTLFGVLIQPGNIDTVAGDGTVASDPFVACTESGPAIGAQLNFPAGIWINSGFLYIADRADHCVRRVDPSGNISTVAGNGTQGYLGDGEAATSAELNLPTSVVLDGAGDLFIADYGNQAVRRVDGSTGVITTIAGDGVLGFAGDGGPAYLALLGNPSGLAFNPNTNALFIADTFSNRIRAIASPAAPAVSLSPPSLAFGNELIATESAASTVTLTNTGSVSLTLSSLALTTDFGLAASTTCNNGMVLTPGETCVIGVIFKPSFAGPETGTLTISDNAPNSPQSVMLSGTGTQSTAVLSSASLLFSDQTIGTTSLPQGLSVTNQGSTPLTINVITISGDFAQTNNCPIPPAAIPASGSCSFSVTFTPTAGGARNGSLTIVESADPNTPRIVNLSGTGVGPGAGLSQTAISFNIPQEVGTTSQPYPVTLSSVGSAALAISSISTTGDFAQTNNCTSSLAPGSNCTINVTFTPTAAGTRSGTLTVTDTAGNSPQSVALTGTGFTQPKAAVSPTSLIFTNQLVGTSSNTQPVTLQNPGTAALAITSIAASASFSETDNCGTSLAPGSTCTVNVTFSPTATGTTTGTLTFTDNASDSPQIVYLTGTGIAPNVALSPTSLSFGNQGITTTSAPLGVALTSTGTAPLVISGITTAGDFAETNNCGTTVPPPTTCTISVTFTPSATGSRSGTLTITDSAATSPQTVTLAGTGIGPSFSLSQASLTFGIPQGVGTTSGVLPIALTSTSTAPLLINSISTSGDFAETNDCPVPPQTTTSCTVNVTFAPTATGSRSGTLTILSNVAGTPTTVALSGTGVPGYAMTVDRSSATVLAGSNSAAFTVSASSQFNFSGTITLSCAGNTSVNCSFVPASITAGKNSILTVSGLGGLAGGTAVSFNVVGTSGPQSASEALSISIADFSLAASSASATVTAGQTATYTLTIQPSGGFNQQIALSCSGAPLAATCAVSSIAVTPDGTDPVSVTVTVTTTAPSTAGTPGMFNRRWPQAPGRLPWLWWIAALLLIAAPVWLRRRRPRYLLLACAAAILAWAACGGGSSQLPILKGTPSGTYTLTVTGVSGSLSHSINLTLNVS